jgi:hypothetical protein
MKINVKYKPANEKIIWFSLDNNKHYSSGYECIEHRLIIEKATRETMTLDGPEQFEEQWQTCELCDQDFDMGEVV